MVTFPLTNLNYDSDAKLNRQSESAQARRVEARGCRLDHREGELWHQQLQAGSGEGDLVARQLPPARHQSAAQGRHDRPRPMENGIKLGIMKIFLPIFIALLIIGGLYYLAGPALHQTKPVACTEEAKLCADGFAVGRIGPNCEFAACPGAESGIKGVVLLGPICPVERIPPDPQCAAKPYRTNLQAMTAAGSQSMKSFSSDQNGNFSVQLPPGEYSIQSAAAANPYLRCSSHGPIQVKAGSFASTTIYCDTGIR